MGGGNKGGGGHTPYEAPDSLKSAQKLRAIGLISLGPIKGTVNKWKTTYFDNTPIQNANGKDDNDTDSFNFKNTEIQFTLGTQDQLPLKGFEASEREVPVNAEVKQAHPLTKTVIDPDVSRLRLTLAVSALFSQNDQGDTHGSSVTFQVLINNLPRNTYTIEGKSSSRFFRSYIIENLPEVPFTVTVKRVTEDSKSQRLQNATSWTSYTEIIDTKLSYPNMALVGIKTDSRYNPNFPNINFLLHGRLVKIPSNYDPVARTYAAGIWKGDFKEDWTNNPAWIFYDLVTNKQIGLGERLGDFGVDKFQLYQIAQYCDQLVPDGYGGQEPRMTANLWITDQRSAYEVLSDMASVFRAMVIWNGQQMTATQDRPADPVCTYTQSNVIDGKFTRQYVAQKAIYTAVEVEYADKRNMYQKAIEYVADDDLIRRYGYNVKKITAFACTSRGQAHRYGKWILETSRLEQCTITFSVGREGLAHLPGDIIEVADNRYANTNLGGRVLSINGKVVTLDRPIDFTADSYLGYLSTTGTAEIVRVKILSVDDKQRVNLDREPVGLVENANWTLHTAQVKTQLYRAIGIAENNDGSFAITALQHEPQKEAIVDNGANFEPLRSTLHQSGLIPPTNPDVTTDGSAITLNFQPPANFIGQGLKYQVKLYRNGNLYNVYDDLENSSLAFNDLPDGDYIAEIRAKNSAGQLSEPTTKAFSINFNISELVTVSKVFGIDLSWRNPLFAALNASIEIWVSKDNQFQHARKLVTLAYPTNSYSYTGLGAAETYWFWARMVNKDAAGRFTAAAEGITERSPQKLVEALHGAITKDAFNKELIGNLANIEKTADDAKVSAESAVKNAKEAGDKVSSMHTIKTQAIAGDRKAIAGIAIGAETDGKTAESSVIVMADKFAVVKNDKDDQVKPVFTIADDKVALNGDIAVKGDLIGNRFVGGEIDISGKDGELKVGRSGAFVLRSSEHNEGLYMDNQNIIIYDSKGRIALNIGKAK
nr:MAG TPA: tail protein [Caudoviricetes sp.]